ncbi:MAG: sigma 54-interacting transcriptional regulator [Bacillota bacterium]|nr:sigma 54-interacting transcriptional regulator [Bacillota bacterium]
MKDNLKCLLFDVIADNSDSGIAVIDSNGIIIYYNQQMSEIEGMDHDEVINRFVFSVFPTFNKKNSTLLKAISTGKPVYNQEQQYINHKGKKIFAVVTDIPIVENGKVLGVVEFAKDLYRTKNLYDSINRLENQHIAYKKNDDPKQRKPNYYTFDDFKTQNDFLKGIIERTKRLSGSDSNVLIFGETGVGKEIIAQSIHNLSGRNNRPFIAQNCAAIPETLLESILFGTTKGSFTGASDRPGLFEQADGGTLLLDELNSMPISLQSKLLRVLQEKYVRRVGATTEKPVDVRVIATVNTNPLALIQEKTLREDLFYRLSVIYIYIPPLRERKEDILYLTNHFMNKYKHIVSGTPPRVSREVKEEFLKYSWDGNVRELENVIESVINTIENEEEIRLEHLPYYLLEKLKKQDLQAAHSIIPGSSLADTIETLEKKLIIEALELSRGNISIAARMLKLKRQTLQNKVKKLGIDKSEFLDLV